MDKENYELICKNYNNLVKENEELQTKVRELTNVNITLIKIKLLLKNEGNNNERCFNFRGNFTRIQKGGK